MATSMEPTHTYTMTTVFHGTTAIPGSVQPRPDARTVQYRLYHDIDYAVYTDGILHQIELPTDFEVH